MASPLPQTRSELRWLVAGGKNLGTNRPLEQIIGDLSWPVPAEYIDWKERPSLIPYLSHDTIAWILNYLAPGWESRTDITQVGNLAVCTLTLTLPTDKGPVVRQTTGSANLDDEGFGGPLPEAEAQALRRAASKYGLGLYLYDSDIVRKLISQKRQPAKAQSYPHQSTETRPQPRTNGHIKASASDGGALANPQDLLI